MKRTWQTVPRSLTGLGAYLRKHRRYALVFVIAGVVALALIGWAEYARRSGLVLADWTGLGSYIDADGKLQRGKSMWDWLELLIVPIVLSLAVFWLQRSERNSEQEKAKDQQRESALQAFLDKMTELLLDETHPLRSSKPDDENRVVARTRTLATLRGLDSERKTILLKFLYEAMLIERGNVIIDLNGADLDEIKLSGADLKNINHR